MEDRETIFAHVDQPAFEQMQIDHNISRIAIFFVCFLTIGVFYFTLVNFSVIKLLPIQQIQSVTAAVQALNPTASRAPAASSKPQGALGGSQITISAAPSASASAAASGSAAPSASASSSAPPLAAGGIYTVQQGDTLLKIANLYGTNAQDIATANNMTVNTNLQIGQKLKIPGRS
ncbi:MAG: LysM peptidoglycan-binding domain-containing protein [Chloroflexi bacterium]|nr:LysM peptidoglycan-binding domain-containing protein [Chloroflexota bacterium]